MNTPFKDLFGNPGIYPFSYYHHPGALYEPTKNLPPISVIGCTTPFAGLISCSLPSPNLADISSLMTTITEKSLEINNAIALIDGDNTQGLLTQISGSTPPGTLYNNLIAASPYLSDTVLLSTIKRVQLLPYGNLKDVIVANSPVTPEVMTELTKKSMPPGIRKEILTAQTGISLRSLLQQEIILQQDTLSWAMNELLRNYLSDTSGSGIDSILAFFPTVPNIEAKKISAEAYLSKNDCAGVTTMLSQISPKDSEDTNFVKYFTVMADLCSTGMPVDSMSQVQIQTILDVAGSASLVSVNARILLAHLADSSITETIEDIILPDSLTIRGHLLENSDCDSRPVAGDTLVVKDYWGNIMERVSPTITDSNGYFSFNALEIAMLDSGALYNIATKSSFTIDTAEYKTATEWLAESPVELTLEGVHEVWQSVYPGSDTLLAIGQVVTLEGNVYSAGFLRSQFSSDDMIVVVKTDPQGNREWVQQYGPAYPVDMLVDPEQNIFVLGSTTVNGNLSILLLKYDSTGVLQWSQVLSPGLLSDYPYDIASDGQGNLYITGTSQDVWESQNILTMKVNDAGAVQWTETVTSGLQDYGQHKIIVSRSGDVIITAQVTTSEGQESGIIRYSDAGSLIWQDTIANYSIEDVEEDESGNIYCVGNFGSDLMSPDVMIMKFTSAGAFLWEVSLEGYINGLGKDYISLDSIGNLTVLNNLDMGYKLSLISTSGNILWSGNVIGNWMNYFSTVDLAFDKDGNSYVAGFVTSATFPSNYRIITSKFSNMGEKLWEHTKFGGYYGDLTVSENNNVYITGGFITSLDLYSSNFNLITYKLSQCSFNAELRSLTDSVQETNSGGDFFTLYPNPNDGSMEISYSIPETETGTFEIFDVVGRRIYSAVLEGGCRVLSFTVPVEQSGVYFYRAIYGDKILAADEVVIIK